MKVTAQLTLDGLVRALRWKAHALAEDIEDRYRPGDDPAPDRFMPDGRPNPAKEAFDDRFRR